MRDDMFITIDIVSQYRITNDMDIDKRFKIVINYKIKIIK